MRAAVCHHFQRLMRAETVADQHSGSIIRFRSWEWIKYLLDPIEIDLRVHIPIFAACEAPAWHCMGLPVADLCGARLCDQWERA
jgi:hypothetical protein